MNSDRIFIRIINELLKLIFPALPMCRALFSIRLGVHKWDAFLMKISRNMHSRNTPSTLQRLTGIQFVKTD